MNTIVLATDGSPSAQEATRQAIRLARDLSARLVVVGVEHVSVPSYGYYGYGEVYNELVEGEHIHVERVLADAAHQAEDEDVIVETVDRKGDTIEAICDVAQKKDARLIVIGSHGWSAVRRFLFGSVSMGVLHHASCPVLVVPAQDVTEHESRVHADAAAI